MLFKNIQPGTFFIYEGWIMLKIKPFRGYDTVIFKPSGKPQVDVSDLIGTLTCIGNNEGITIINKYRFIISGE